MGKLSLIILGLVAFAALCIDAEELKCGEATECPAVQGDEDILLPHPDCTKFYQCVDGEQHELDCMPGLHFNAELCVCDWPQNAGCEEVEETK